MKKLFVYMLVGACCFFACSEEAGKWMFGDKEFKIIKNKQFQS